METTMILEVMLEGKTEWQRIGWRARNAEAKVLLGAHANRMAEANPQDRYRLGYADLRENYIVEVLKEWNN